MLAVHDSFSWFVVLANAAAGGWALGAHWVPALRGRPVWVVTIVAQLAIVAQVALGVWLVAVEGIEADEFHVFYGFVMVITIGLVYSYRQQLDPWRYLLYGFGGLFLMGLGIRAMVLHA
ncbi:MAG TPA: hypothetical protein VK866_11345 [Acidimicrobiales bacterium]|nr:hypothetical protein [Acidimicrobiales bacterium]